MSYSNPNFRMATSIALALTTAAITACGGGGTSVDEQTANAGSTAVAAGAASATTAETYVTTNTAAVTSTQAATDANGNAASSSDITQAAVTDSSAAAPVTSTSAQASTGTNSTAAEIPPTTPDTTVASSQTLADATPQASTGTHVGTVGSAPRPAGNTGTGFYVSGGKLYDPKGVEFRIRGVNRNHWDSYGTPAGLPLSGANTERVVLKFANTTQYNMNIVQSQMLDNGIVPIPGSWLGTCKADVATLNGIVDTWVEQASTWTQLNSKGLINIANEWGPANSTVWRDAYIAAIARMRAAGYTGTLVVDSGGCGQDAQDIVKYGPAVLAADPQKNILFDVHVYGGFHYPATASWMQDYNTAMAQLKASGLPLILGEFGPGRNVGPSPTMVTPEQVIATAEANGWGWMPWSWDDNNLANCSADDNGFSMTRKCGTYKTDADLTTFGKTIVPILKSKAIKANISK